MKTHRIAVLMTVNGALQQELVEGITSNLGPRYEIKTFEAMGPNSDRIAELARSIVQAGFDAIVPIGMMTSKVVKNVFRSARSGMPVFLSAVRDPVGFSLIDSLHMPGENITGVGLKSSPKILPAQFLLQMKPGAKNVLLPYNPHNLDGRFAHIAQEIKQSFSKRGVTVRLMPARSVNEAVSLVRKRLSDDSGIDSLMFLYGDLLGDAYEQLIDDCKNHNVTMFANGKDAIKKGAVFALRADMKFSGTKIAEQIKCVLEKGKRAGEIPFKMLDNNVRLAVNVPAAQAQGVTLSDEIVTAYDGKGYYEELPVYKVAFVDYALVRNYETITGIIDAFKSEKAITFKKHISYTTPYGMEDTEEYIKGQITEAFKHYKCDLLVVGSLAHEKLAYKLRLELGCRHIPIVTIIDGSLHPENALKLRPPHSLKLKKDKRYRFYEIPQGHASPLNVYRAILAPHDPVDQVESARFVHKNISQLIVPLFAQNDESVDHIVKPLEAYAQEEKIQIKFFVTSSHEDYKAFLERERKWADALVLYESFVCYNDPHWLRHWCHTQDLLVVGGGIELGFEGAAVAHGYDVRFVGQYIVGQIKKILYNQVPVSETKNVYFEEVALTVLNHNSFQKRGIKIPKGVTSLLSNSLFVSGGEHGNLLGATPDNYNGMCRSEDTELFPGTVQASDCDSDLLIPDAGENQSESSV